MNYHIDLNRLAEIARRVERDDPSWRHTAPAREIKPERRPQRDHRKTGRPALPVVIGGVPYPNTKAAAEQFHVFPEKVNYWVQMGYMKLESGERVPVMRGRERGIHA
jgi:hypothetical protein